MRMGGLVDPPCSEDKGHFSAYRLLHWAGCLSHPAKGAQPLPSKQDIDKPEGILEEWPGCVPCDPAVV